VHSVIMSEKYIKKSKQAFKEKTVPEEILG
jgi:hypothetical protein